MAILTLALGIGANTAIFSVLRAVLLEPLGYGGPRVAILSHGFWQRRYGGDPAIVGNTILLNAVPTTVVGVLPRSFKHVEPNPEREAEIFAPYQFDTAEPNRGAHFIRAVGRLREGVSLDSGRAQVSTIATRLEREHPDENTGLEMRLDPLHEALVREARPEPLLLAGAVAFVLLVACATLANLLLAGGMARQRELALRAAIGGGGHGSHGSSWWRASCCQPVRRRSASGWRRRRRGCFGRWHTPACPVPRRSGSTCRSCCSRLSARW